jgi:hypothetical protein
MQIRNPGLSKSVTGRRLNLRARASSITNKSHFAHHCHNASAEAQMADETPAGSTSSDPAVLPSQPPPRARPQRLWLIFLVLVPVLGATAALWWPRAHARANRPAARRKAGRDRPAPRRAVEPRAGEEPGAPPVRAGRRWSDPATTSNSSVLSGSPTPKSDRPNVVLSRFVSSEWSPPGTPTKRGQPAPSFISLDRSEVRCGSFIISPALGFYAH